MKKIPVIQGMIHEDKPPEVSLKWATGYNSTEVSYINDAIVWITDNEGNMEVLELRSPGLYLPVHDEFKGIAGRTYILHVETSSGDLFESTCEKIESAPQIDSLYAIPVKKSIYVRDGSGDLNLTDKKGLDIGISLRKNSGSTCYFRFQTNLLTERTYDLIRSGIKVYEWIPSFLDDFYSVRFSYTKDSFQMVPEHIIGFVEFNYNSAQATWDRSAPYPECWIISMHVYCISPQVFEYYNSVAKMLNADDGIFAPVPFNAKSNIRCVNDDRKKVVGTFEASAEITLHKAFSWISLYEYKSKVLDYFPDKLRYGFQYSTPPDFWVAL